MAEDLSLAARVLDCVERIPAGRVMSYGDVAEFIGTRAARNVGRILAADGGTVPWHRVLRADGSSAPHIADEQVQRLRSEGVRFKANGKVDMAASRWDGR